MQRHNNKTIDIILASNSPRRKELLRQIGIIFKSYPAHIDESALPGETPEVYAVRVASDKAIVAAREVKKGIVIAADTIVVIDDTILGKPADKKDAEVVSASERRLVQWCFIKHVLVFNIGLV